MRLCVQASASLGPDTTQIEGADASWHNESTKLQTLVPCTTCAVYASHADVRHCTAFLSGMVHDMS